MNPLPTIVTAYYGMPSKYPESKYEVWLANFLRTMNCNIVFFVEHESIAQKLVEKCSFKERVLFRILPLSEFETVKQFGVSFWQEQLSKDPDKLAHKSWSLGALWHQKNEFIKRVVEENPWKSTEFYWCDAGLLRDAQAMQRAFLFGCKPILVQEQTKFDVERLQILQVKFASRSVHDCVYKPYLGAGILCGTAEAWHSALQEYEEARQKMIDQGACIFKEQNVWNYVALLQKPVLQIHTSFDDWLGMLSLFSGTASPLPTFIINLDRRVDRWRSFTKSWTLDDETYRFPAIENGTKPFGFAQGVQNGCTASHHYLMLQYGKCLVLEDDAIPAKKTVTLQLLKDLVLAQDAHTTTWNNTVSKNTLMKCEPQSWHVINFGSTSISLWEKDDAYLQEFSPTMLQSRYTGATHCVAYNSGMQEFANKFKMENIKKSSTIRKECCIDYQLTAMNAKLVQLIPKNILVVQKQDYSDLANGTVQYDDYFTVVENQLQHYLLHPSLPVRAPLVGILFGGLGNQLFQASAAIFYAKQLDRPVLLVYEDETRCKVYRDTIFRNFTFLKYSKGIPKLVQDPLWNKELDSKAATDAPYKTFALHGYFQHYKYAKEGVHMFHDAIDDCIMNGIDESYDALLHVRGADYVGLPLYAIDYESYYRKALHLCSEGAKKVAVVTNDVTLAKRLLQNVELQILELDELQTLKYASHLSKPFIACNSTFSWWMAMFRMFRFESDKVSATYFPSKWFGTSNSPNAAGLYEMPNVTLVEI